MKKQHSHFLPGLLATAILATLPAVCQTIKTTTTTTDTPTSASTATPPSTTTEQETETQTPQGVELEVGIGSRIGGPGISNYQISNGILSLTNLGRATPQLVTGLGFSFCEPGSTKSTTKTTKGNTTTTTSTATARDISAFCQHAGWNRLGVFVAAQFGQGSAQTISGYTIGGTFGASKYLRFLAGFTLTPVSEISPGFAKAAADYVNRNSALFPSGTAAAITSNAYGAFDGIQVTTTAPAEGAKAGSAIYYPGAVLTNHYRGGFMIGVALPINIYNLLGGNKAGK